MKLVFLVFKRAYFFCTFSSHAVFEACVKVFRRLPKDFLEAKPMCPTLLGVSLPLPISVDRLIGVEPGSRNAKISKTLLALPLKLRGSVLAGLLLNWIVVAFANSRCFLATWSSYLMQRWGSRRNCFKVLAFWSFIEDYSLVLLEVFLFLRELLLRPITLI